MGGSSGIINLGAFVQAGFIILVAVLLVIGALCVLWRWRNNLPTYQCKKCTGVFQFQVTDASPLCPFCGSTSLYLKDLGGD